MEAMNLNIPVLALRGLTVFPHMTMTFDVERRISIRALERAMEENQEIFLVTQREIGTETPGEKDLYAVGTISHITQILRLSKSSVRVMVEGRRRARLRRLWQCKQGDEQRGYHRSHVLEYISFHFLVCPPHDPFVLFRGTPYRRLGR